MCSTENQIINLVDQVGELENVSRTEGTAQEPCGGTGLSPGHAGSHAQGITRISRVHPMWAMEPPASYAG